MVAHVRTVAYENMDARLVDVQGAVGDLTMLTGKAAHPLWATIRRFASPFCLAIAVLLSACGTPAPFDAIHAGRGFTDPSGDDPYGSFSWCGDRLWLDNDDGFTLIDPANGERRLVAPRDSIEGSNWAGRLMRCVGRGGDTVFWLDRFPDGIAWRRATGEDGGAFDNVARDEVWAVPLLTFDKGTVLAVAETGKEIAGDRLPAGIKLISLDRGLIERNLPDTDHILSLDLLDADTAFVTYRGPDYSYEGAFLALDPVSRKATIRAASLTRERGIVPWDFLSAVPDLDRQGHARLRIVANGAALQCVLAEPLAAGPPAVCSEDTEVELQEALRRALPTAQEISISPSEMWVAWAELKAGDDGLDGAVEIYVAPVARILPK